MAHFAVDWLVWCYCYRPLHLWALRYLTWRNICRLNGRFTPDRFSFAYGLNTAGALLGVLLGTFVLIAAFGVVGSSRVAAGVSAACGLMACLMSRLDRNDQPVDRLAKRPGRVAYDWATEVVVHHRRDIGIRYDGTASRICADVRTGVSQ